MRDYDLVVIGGGTAGLGAARTGAAHGASVALVTDGRLGGECTFTGCIPSKTWLEEAAAGVSYADAARRVHDAVERIAATESAEVLAGEGVTVLTGHARLDGPGRILVDGSPIAARRFIIATGSTPAIPRIDGLDRVDYLTTDTVFTLDRLPASTAILGGGAIGCELAHALTGLGSQVTLLEAAPCLLPAEDPDAVRVIANRLDGLGVSIRTGARIRRVHAQQNRVVLTDTNPNECTVVADRLLVVTGRRPATQDLGLDTIGADTDDRGNLKVDRHLATTAAGVYAAGDVTGLYDFTHAADAMARIAAGNALARRPSARFATAAIPRVIFTDPELAQVGVTEVQAAQRKAVVCFVPMAEVDRAITADRTEGFVKLITAPAPLTRRLGGGRVVGATVVAPRAGELIGEITLAMRTGMFAGRLAQTTHAYPTWSHAIQLAAAQLFGHGRRPYPVGGRPATRR